MPGRVVGFHHLSLSVTDLARSTAWYQAVLGVEVIGEVEGKTFRRVRLRSPGDGVTLTLTCHDQQPDGPFDERRVGMDHVALAVAPGSVPAFLAHFDELGVEHSQMREYEEGVATITFRDPDNIQLEVFG